MVLAVEAIAGTDRTPARWTAVRLLEVLGAMLLLGAVGIVALTFAITRK